MDIYQEITNRMIKEMEAGIIPWKRPWMASGAAISHTTGKAYSLLNQMLLGKAGEYPDLRIDIDHLCCLFQHFTVTIWSSVSPLTQ